VLTGSAQRSLTIGVADRDQRGHQPQAGRSARSCSGSEGHGSRLISTAGTEPWSSSVSWPAGQARKACRAGQFAERTALGRGDSSNGLLGPPFEQRRQQLPAGLAGLGEQLQAESGVAGEGLRSAPGNR